MKAPLLEFYFFDSCPYCQRVMTIIDTLKIHVIYKDIQQNAKDAQKLFAITGRQTVPCLFIDSIPMHESLEIISWLKTNIERLDKTL